MYCPIVCNIADNIECDSLQRYSACLALMACWPYISCWASLFCYACSQCSLCMHESECVKLHCTMSAVF